MFARRPAISRQLVRDVAFIALSFFAVTCSGDKTTQPPPGPTQLAFKVNPGSSAAGATFAPSVVVEAHDANGNLVSDFTGTIALTITNPSGATLAGTTSINAVGGVATFSNLNITKAGTGYILQATSGSLTAANSSPFSITAATAANLAFTSVPTSFAAGAPFAITVTAQDAYGNTATTFTGQVTLGLNATGGATLSGTLIVTANGGVANFINLTIDKIGSGFSFSATGGGLTGGTSGTFTVSPGPATDLVITGQPSNTVAAASITPAVAVTAHDAMGNVASQFAAQVCIAITSGTGAAGATLGGTACTNAASGVASFSNLTIGKAGTGYTLTATSTGLNPATTAPFNITAGTASVLVYLTAPSSSFAGSAITPAVQVAAEDGSGNVVPSFTGSIAIAIANNAAGGTLSGTTSAVASAGVASFANLSIDKAGTGYTLSASTAGLSGVTSSAFNILSGTGATLVFVVEPPASNAAGLAISPAIQVAVHDSLGNTATSFNGPVTITIGNNPAGGTLTGTTTMSAVAGVATFASLMIDKIGTGYTFSAAASVLTPAVSTPFDIVAGQPSKLIFTQGPSSPQTAGASITPALKVTAVDAGGNPVTSFTNLVTITLTPGSGNPAATLSGTNAVSAVAGVATFSGLSIDKAGTGYTLDAASAGLTGVTSAAFNIAPGLATQLVYSAQPTTTPAAGTMTPAVTVTALDAQQNIATGFTGNVALAITSGTGTAGAILTGGGATAAVAGVATFSNLSVDKAGTGYTLTAAASGVSSAVSSAFDIVVGGATKLAFTVQPSNLITGGTISPAVQVTAQDAGGNTVTGFTGDILLAIGTNPGGGTLSGTLTVTAAAGVASFANLSIDKSGTGYTLTAASNGLTGATSTAFNVAAGVAKTLVFTVQPSTGAGGVAITPAVVVTALDSLGNTATGFTGNVTMAIGTNPSAGNLTGTTSVAAVAGVATFANLMLDKPGTGYTLVASSTGLTGATSTPFDITIGAATKLAVLVQPVATTAGVPITPAIQVVAQDAVGNTVPTFVGGITLAIKSGTGTSGATLRGTVTVGAVAGIATFSTVNIDKAGNGYVLNATSTGLTGVSTQAFNITVGPAVALLFTAQPAASQKSGTTLTPTIKVAVVDSLLNTVTAFSTNINIAIGNNAGTPVPGTLTGTLSVKPSNGVASFNTLKIDKIGTGYTLVASSTGVLSATSTAFNVTPGSAATMTFTTQPLSTTALATMPAVAVTAFDAAGNVATGFTGNVTVALGTIPTLGAALHGTATVKASAGVATFSTLFVDSVGNGYTMTATTTPTPPTGATSASFDITNGSKLVFSVQPTAVNAGSTITPAVQVTAKDASNLTLTSFTGPVTVAILGGTGTAGAVLSGTLTVSAVAGVATFPNLAINLGGTGYKLTASSSGFTAGTSNAFTVNSTVGAAVKLGFIQQPSNTPAGSIIAPGVIVAAQDAAGNTVKGLTGTITIAIGNNAGGNGTLLSGTTTVNIGAGEGAFSNLSINNLGTGYTLAATTSLGLTPATSAPFNITAAATTHLAFSVQPPAATTAGQVLTPAIQVSMLNGSNAVVTSFNGPITVAIAAGTGAVGATLGGTTTVSAVNGVATFSTLFIQKSGTGFKLQATSTGSAAATSTSFTINPDVAILVHFNVQPTTGTHGTTITPAVVVDARDQFNNIVKTFTGTVNLAIAAGTGTAGAVLSGTTSTAAVGGFATFSNLSINLVGTGYKLTATSTGLTSATSSAFSEN